MKKRFEPRERLNLEVYNTPLEKEKLTGEELLELTKYVTNYHPFTVDLENSEGKILTIKQFCLHLAQEMSYHRNIDKIEGLVHG